jgi:hypothetical protein
MRILGSPTNTTPPYWLLASVALALGILLTLLRVRWERVNIVTTTGAYEESEYAGLVNNYRYMDEGGEIHSQSFPILLECRSRFEVQYYRTDPANGWIKTGIPSAPLMFLMALDVLFALLVLGVLWQAIQIGRIERASFPVQTVPRPQVVAVGGHWARHYGPVTNHCPSPRTGFGGRRSRWVARFGGCGGATH